MILLLDRCFCHDSDELLDMYYDVGTQQSSSPPSLLTRTSRQTAQIAKILGMSQAIVTWPNVIGAFNHSIWDRDYRVLIVWADRATARKLDREWSVDEAKHQRF
jgi:hypothetical protein